MLDGNFQDYVSLTQDTLRHKGAQLALGTTTASTVQALFSNSAGALALAATATGNATAWLPPAGGTLATAVNVSAGAAAANLSAVVFSNSNGVSFGMSGSTLTMSAGAGASINLSAGTTSNLGSAFTLSNQNSVSFGLNAGTVTASVSGMSSLNVSAGTTSQNLTGLTFSLAAGNDQVSWGLSGSTITAQLNDQSEDFVVAAGTQTAIFGEIPFANSNMVSWGMSGSSQVTASTFTQAGQITAVNVSAGTTSQNLSAVTFHNSNGFQWGLQGSTITAVNEFNISAGTTSQGTNAFTFSNSNGVSFGMNGSTITGSYGLNISASTTSQNLSNVVLSNSNGIMFGVNGATATAKLGGISSWSNGEPFASFANTSAQVSFQPVVIDYNLTVTNVVQLISMSGLTNSSSAYTMRVGVYVVTGGTALSFVSFGSSQVSWTSGAAYSSQSGNQYVGMTVNSWAFTPGPYVLAVGGVDAGLAGSASFTLFAVNSNVIIGSGRVAALSAQVLPGILSGATTFPTTLALSATGQYVRTGGSVLQQPWIVLQGS
jgi:hypothetical protein